MNRLIGQYSSLFRAIEIAKVGNLSVSIYFDDDYTKGFEDYNSIKQFCKGWFDNFVSEGDIKIEIVKPENYESKLKFESLEDITKRIDKTLTFVKPEIILCDSCIALIKTATNYCNFSYSQVEKIKFIASIIAQMDNYNFIAPMHIAESIQYANLYNENLINGEAKSKIFGNMIEIKLGYIDKEQIDLAIEYLKNIK